MKRFAITQPEIPEFIDSGYFDHWSVLSVVYRDWQRPWVLFLFGG